MIYKKVDLLRALTLIIGFAILLIVRFLECSTKPKLDFSTRNGIQKFMVPIVIGDIMENASFIFILTIFYDAITIRELAMSLPTYDHSTFFS